MSSIDLKEQVAGTARAVASGRRSRPESESIQKKGLANRNVKRRLNTVKPRGEKTQQQKPTSASATRTPAAKVAKKDITKTSQPARRPASSKNATRKRNVKTGMAKKASPKSAMMDAKAHGGLFINEMRLSAASPVTSSVTTASSLRLSPSPLSSSAGGRSPRASSGVACNFSSSDCNTSLAQRSPKSEITRIQADSATTRSISKPGGLFRWLTRLWS